MTLHLRLMALAYRWLVRWYPPLFQAEFGEEMQGVFNESLLRSAEDSLWVQAALLGRELKDMPASILKARLNEKKGVSAMSTPAQESPVTRQALIGLTLYFIFVGTYEMIHIPGSLMENPILKILFPTVLLVIMFGPLVVGVFQHLPRWSMFFVGLPLAVLAVYVVHDALERRYEPQILFWMRQVLSPNAWSNRLLWQWFYQGRFWLAILLTVTFLIGFTALLPRFRSFAGRIGRDWTHLSFLFYGASLLLFFIDFDEYRYDEWYRLGSMLALAAGAWGYLRAGTPQRRTLWLLVGITVCMAIMGVGKYFLVPLQDWPVWFSRHPVETERWFESLRTIATWFWMALFIGLPGFAQSLRRSALDAPLEQPADYVSSPAR
jgi:hypothetical protein